jgi:hypothetical protein
MCAQLGDVGVRCLFVTRLETLLAALDTSAALWALVGLAGATRAVLENY